MSPLPGPFQRSIGLSLLLLSPGSGLEALPVRTGADQILEEPYLNWIRGRRVGLITNQTGVDSNQVPVYQLLDEYPEVELVALFSPEHGLEGTVPAGEAVPARGRIFSLYGDHKAPTPQMLENVDVLIYDIQDVGVRFYTYISTLYLSLKAAGLEKIPFVVLDRPNPIDGSRVEGPMVHPGFESFVGIHAIPIRYGMTPGELAAMFNREAGLGAELKVVPLSGWSREAWYDETGLTWVPPSPNMRNLNTAALYPGLCLIEATNLSEGRGTPNPFEWVGAPWVNSGEVVRRMNRLQMAGVRFREETFTPISSKYRGQPSPGVRIEILDRDRAEPLPLVLRLLETIRDLHPARLQIEGRFFDQLAGSSRMREGLSRKTPAPEIQRIWQGELEDFRARRSAYLLYP